MEPYRDIGTYTGEVSGFEGAIGKLVRARRIFRLQRAEGHRGLGETPAAG
jgi:hypothetical protein